MKKLYDKSPVIIQNLMCSLAGYKINYQRYDNNFKKIFADYVNRGSWSKEALITFRDNRLKSFVRHAFETTEYYPTLFGKLGIHPDDIQSLEDLAHIPILTKSEVKANYDQFISNAVPSSHVVMAHTSGTTGSGLVFPTTKHALHEQWAVWWRYRMQHGISRQMWCGYFGGRPIVPIKQVRQPYWRINFPAKQIMYSAYHINDQTIDAYVDDIVSRKLAWLHGYPSILSLIAGRVLHRGLRKDVNVSVVTTGAENLNDHQKHLISLAFDLQPKQHYGLAEGVANISENAEGDLCVDEDFSAVEFVDFGRGLMKDIVGTNYANLAFPLIRYNTGDQVEWTEQNTASTRFVKSINGRAEDYLVLNNGAKIGRLDHILKDAVRISESQFIQDRAGHAVLQIVPAFNFTKEDEKSLRQEIYSFLGDKITIEIVKVTKIPRTEAGKLKFVINRM